MGTVDVIRKEYELVQNAYLTIDHVSADLTLLNDSVDDAPFDQNARPF